MLGKKRVTPFQYGYATYLTADRRPTTQPTNTKNTHTQIIRVVRRNHVRTHTDARVTINPTAHRDTTAAAAQVRELPLRRQLGTRKYTRCTHV